MRINLSNVQIITPTFTVAPRIIFAGGDTELINWLSIGGATGLTLLPDTSIVGLGQQLPVDWLGTIDPKVLPQRQSARLLLDSQPQSGIGVDLGSFKLVSAPDHAL